MNNMDTIILSLLQISMRILTKRKDSKELQCALIYVNMSYLFILLI